ncbi:DUF4296 domain-containing protein [Flavobacterium sp.]|uniref:DUF4296 domain-containing protein n=1 Tax=Flavobacterium sp. TaxID=239 RepID=UPI0025CE2F58|nr:DUF4296 domain-containing protein [Flavobacterium sp.]
MMRKNAVIILFLFTILSCNNSSLEKPKNLIEKDKMISILYDMSLLESIKSQNIAGGISSKKPNEYIYKKYKIDSIQLLKSNKYYAADIEEYKKMFEEVKNRVDEETKKIDGNKKNQSTPPSPDAPQVQ